MARAAVKKWAMRTMLSMFFKEGRAKWKLDGEAWLSTPAAKEYIYQMKRQGALVPAKQAPVLPLEGVRMAVKNLWPGYQALQLMFMYCLRMADLICVTSVVLSGPLDARVPTLHWVITKGLRPRQEPVSYPGWLKLWLTQFVGVTNPFQAYRPLIKSLLGRINLKMGLALTFHSIKRGGVFFHDEARLPLPLLQNLAYHKQQATTLSYLGWRPSAVEMDSRIEVWRKHF